MLSPAFCATYVVDIACQAVSFNVTVVDAKLTPVPLAVVSRISNVTGWPAVLALTCAVPTYCWPTVVARPGEPGTHVGLTLLTPAWPVAPDFGAICSAQLPSKLPPVTCTRVLTDVLL